MPETVSREDWGPFTNHQSMLGRRVYGDLVGVIRYVTDPYEGKTWVYRYEKDDRQYRLVEEIPKKADLG